MAVVPIETREKQAGSRAPAHLRPETARWYRSVVSEWALEDHHLKILLVACEMWDRAADAREVIQAHGSTYLDRWQQPHVRPEVKVEYDSKSIFLRAVRELDLDLTEPVPAGRRPPPLRSNRPRGG